MNTNCIISSHSPLLKIIYWIKNKPFTWNQSSGHTLKAEAFFALFVFLYFNPEVQVACFAAFYF